MLIQLDITQPFSDTKYNNVNTVRYNKYYNKYFHNAELNTTQCTKITEQWNFETQQSSFETTKT